MAGPAHWIFFNLEAEWTLFICHNRADKILWLLEGQLFQWVPRFAGNYSKNSGVFEVGLFGLWRRVQAEPFDGHS